MARIDEICDDDMCPNCDQLYGSQEEVGRVTMLCDAQREQIERLTAENVRWKEIHRAFDTELRISQRLLQRVVADIDLWSVTGRHRTCNCPACDDLRDVAARAAGGE